MQKLKLLNPGPVTLTQRVRESLVKPDLCHREIEFSELQKDILSRLNKIYPESKKNGFESVLLSGSGTAAVEAMLQSVLSQDSKSLVVANGVYGERMEAMLKAQKKSFEIIKSDWSDPLDLLEVEKRIVLSKKSSIPFTHILSIHHETTTGRLNDIEGLGKLCREYGVPLLLDAVSSFAGEWIDFENWNLQAVAATANKCIHGVPGVCFVVAKKEVLNSIEGNSSSVYLDLFRYWSEQSKTGFSPFTQAVQSLFALQAALEELEEQGGWKVRHDHYLSLSEYVRDKLKQKGIDTFLASNSSYSALLTSFHMPKNRTYVELHDHLKKNGFIIYAGQGQFSGEIFRIATMGDLNIKDMETLINLI